MRPTNVRFLTAMLMGEIALICAGSNAHAQFGGIKISPPKIDIPKPPSIKVPDVRVPSVNDFKNAAAEADRKRLEAQRELQRKAAEADQKRIEAQRELQRQAAEADRKRIETQREMQARAEQAGRDLDRKRLEMIRNAEHAASEQSYFAYRNWVESKNTHIRPITLQPGTLHHQLIEPVFAGMLNISRIRFFFGAFVPADMAAITFDDRIYIDQPYDPNDPNLATLLAHELAHSLQYSRLGGEKQFAWRYFGQIGGQIRNGNFNVTAVHDKLELEQDAARFEHQAKLRVQQYFNAQYQRQIAANRQRDQFDRERMPMPPSFDRPGSGESNGTDQNRRDTLKPAVTYASNLGIHYTKVTYQDGTFGARVSQAPHPGTPAAVMGLEVGDIVLELDGERFRSERNVLEHRYKTTVKLINVRDQQVYISEVMIP